MNIILEEKKGKFCQKTFGTHVPVLGFCGSLSFLHWSHAHFERLELQDLLMYNKKLFENNTN
jgi:hypothetical protein